MSSDDQPDLQSGGTILGAVTDLGKGAFDIGSQVVDTTGSGIKDIADKTKDVAIDLADKTKDVAISAYDKAKGLGKTAYNQTQFGLEYTMLKGFGIPDEWIEWWQKNRVSLGWGAPSGTQLLQEGIAVPILMSTIIGMIALLLKGGISYIINFFINGFRGKLRNPILHIAFLLIMTVIMWYTVTTLYYYFGPKTLPDTGTAKQAQAGIGGRSGFQNMEKPVDSEYRLVNIQPLGTKQTGFLGPKEEDGSFDPSVTVMSAVRAGATFFTLQIDYIDVEKSPLQYERKGKATMVYRNGKGELISSNSAKISDVAENIAGYVFNPDVRASKYPVIVYLHFVRTPDPIRDPKGYVNFLGDVAEGLKPIQPFILKSDSQNNYRRQQSEVALLELSLASIENNIILMCNIDTSMFRNTNGLGVTINQDRDLDSLVNMRVYLESEDDRLGLTQSMQPPMLPNAVIMSYSRLKRMIQSDRDKFAMKGKKRFVIAMPDQLENPTVADMKNLLDTTGVNVIPLNLIGTDANAINALITPWANSIPYYRVKQMILQSFKITTQPNGSG